MSTGTPRLEDAIRVHFAPLLRREGFKGTGRTFRQLLDGAIHLVNVQGFYYGGRFAVNMSVHPVALPCVGGGIADSKRITEEKCEFRCRLTDGVAGHVWDHDGTTEGMAFAVANAAQVFERCGPPFFQLFSGPTSVIHALSPTDFSAEANRLGAYCMGSPIRFAYTLARLRELSGMHEDAIAFAKWALSHGAQPSFEGYPELLKLANGA